MNCIECECYICLHQYECGECGNCGSEYIHDCGYEDYVEDIDKTLDDIEKAIEWLEYIKNGYSWTANCDKAVDKAIASLECINEIIELIKNSSDKQYRNNGHWIYIGDKKGLADVLDIINKHLGE